MKKHMQVWRDGEKSLEGITEEVRWKSTAYYGGPDTPGECITSDGKGNICTLYGTGGNENGSELVSKYLNDMRCSDLCWNDNCKKLTDSEIIILWNEYHIWYREESYDEGDGFYITVYYVYRGDDIPKYFLEPNAFKGPIDTEIDTYEEVIEK